MVMCMQVRCDLGVILRLDIYPYKNISIGNSMIVSDIWHKYHE